jgi:hypothetical protein
MVAIPGKRTRCKAGKVEQAHLERQQKESPGHSLHGSGGGDGQGDEWRNKRVDFHAGHEKEHTPPFVNFFTKLAKIDIAVKG